ncbi:MAG: hypothetical protein WC943_17490, partial [Elusimicrobiota bacterium]
MTSGRRAWLWSPALWAGLVFLVLMFRPAAIAVLRQSLAETSPAEWQSLPTNGSFAVLVPELMHSRWYDEANYAARVNQVLLHGAPYGPYWAELREPEHWLAGFLTYYILAAPAFLLSGDLNLAWLVSGALVGAGWFLLFHAVFRWWSGRDETALPLALFSVLFPDVFFWFLDVNLHAPVVLDRLRTTFFQTNSLVLPYFRRMPSYHLTFFLGCLLLLGAWRLAACRERRPAAALLLGLGFGLMAFVHYFEYAYGMAVLGFFAIGAFLAGLPRPSRWNLSAALGSALLGAAGLALLQRAVTTDNTVFRAPYLAAVEFTRRPTPMAVVHLALAGLLWALMRRERDEVRRAAWLLLAAAQVAAFCARNGQVLTGWTAQPFHFIPMAGFLGCVAFFLWLSTRLSDAAWWTRRTAAAAVLVVSAWALANEAVAARRTYRMLGLPASVEAGYAWVRANLPKDALVLTPSMPVNAGLPIYTGAKTDIPPIAGPVLVFFTRDEYLGRVARLLKTCRVDPERFIQERWLLPGPAKEVRDRAAAAVNREGRVSAEDVEADQWFFCWSYTDHSEELVRAGHARLRELYAAARPLDGRFWVWLNDRDRPLLSETPEEWGTRKVFQVQGVTIYESVPGARQVRKAKP